MFGLQRVGSKKNEGKTMSIKLGLDNFEIENEKFVKKDIEEEVKKNIV
jgi:hypothetical protein